MKLEDYNHVIILRNAKKLEKETMMINILMNPPPSTSDTSSSIPLIYDPKRKEKSVAGEIYPPTILLPDSSFSMDFSSSLRIFLASFWTARYSFLPSLFWLPVYLVSPLLPPSASSALLRIFSLSLPSSADALCQGNTSSVFWLEWWSFWPSPTLTVLVRKFPLRTWTCSWLDTAVGGSLHYFFWSWFWHLKDSAIWSSDMGENCWHFLMIVGSKNIRRCVSPWLEGTVCAGWMTWCQCEWWDNNK